MNYAVQKLEQAGLVTTRKVGKEKHVETSPAGAALCERYGEIRQELLLNSVNAAMPLTRDLSSVAMLLRTLSGIYNQAARAAATL